MLSPTLLEGAARRLDQVVEAAGRLAAWTGLALVLVMAGNVLLRYAFRTGSVAMQELEWHLMAPVSLLCIAYAIKREGHVRVDILYGRMGERARQLVDLASALAALALALIIMWLAIPYVMQSFNIGESSPDPGGLPHRWILKATIPAGFALVALQSLASVLRALIPLVGSGRPAPLTTGAPSHAAE